MQNMNHQSDNADNMQPVSIVKCEAVASDEEVMKAVYHAVELIGGCEKAFSGKKKILVKPNIGTNRLQRHQGRLVYLTEPIIVDAVIGIIRECTDAEIIIGDICLGKNAENTHNILGYDRIVEKYDNIRLVNFNLPPYESIPVENPVMFSSYIMSRELCDVDATVSIAKMKAHHAQGATLCLKNLFGLPPAAVYGAPRMYLHDALVRLPRVVVDLGNMFKPCLCIVDALVAANHSEWNGDIVDTNLIMAGYDAVAVDTIGMSVMGLDPNADYPDYPFFYHNNPLKIAADVGLGENNPENIRVLGCQVSDVKKQFETKPVSLATAVTNEHKEKGKNTVRIYRESRDKFVDKYRNKYLAMENEKPLWSADTIGEAVSNMFSQGTFANFAIKVVPEEEETEILDVYDRCL